MHEIHLCVKLTTMQLTKVTNDKSTLYIEYNKFMMERDEVEQRTGRLKNIVHNMLNKRVGARETRESVLSNKLKLVK
jgi:hypothetical protein